MINAIIPLCSPVLPLSVRRRIAQQIRAWRGDHSQQDVADAAGVSRAQVSNWERNLAQAPDIHHVWTLEAFKPGFAQACGVRVAPFGTPRRSTWAGRPKKVDAGAQVAGPEPASVYESTSLMYEQLAAQVVEHSVSANERVRVSDDVLVATIQGAYVAAGEVLDLLYVAKTDGERDAVANAVLARLSAIADAAALALDNKDFQPAAIITSSESRAILADCLALTANQNAA
jgi:predicted transcriptional regulator